MVYISNHGAGYLTFGILIKYTGKWFIFRELNIIKVKVNMKQKQKNKSC